MPELLLPEFQILPVDERPVVVAAPPRVADLFRVRGRYLRSVHLEQDFDDPACLEHYVLTPPMVAVFSRILDGLRSGSGHRAWRITGDYGTGKSSFALMLAHLLRNTEAPEVKVLRDTIQPEVGDLTGVRLEAVLVTGAREPLVPAIGRAVQRAVVRLRGRRGSHRTLDDIGNRAAAAARSVDMGELLQVLTDLSHYTTKRRGGGVLLVLDEMGKFLEYAALNPERDDVYGLQQLAEAGSRSGRHPLAIVGLLHQGFHSYAERLPHAARAEWEKVAGRYEDIAFDQPLVHVAALVSGALNHDFHCMPSHVVSTAKDVQEAAVAAGWYPPAANVSSLDLYPLHPMVLPVAVRFFARFGQHERSLFSFLLSSEPFGLQQFADRDASGATWYRLADFYDYVRAVFGHRLAGASYQSQWLRISGTVDRVVSTSDLSALEIHVLKTVAVLNVLDAEQLLATDVVLGAAIWNVDIQQSVSSAVASLRQRGLLFDRGAAGGYCLWPNTSVNLATAFDLAQRTLGSIERVSAEIKPYLEVNPIVARRHYIQTGTLRFFDLRQSEVQSLLEVAKQPTEADGTVLVALCESASERNDAAALAADPEIASRRDVLLAIPPPLRGLEAELQDYRCWQWVADNTPELTHDSYAAVEVARQVAGAKRSLGRKVTSQFGLRGDATGVEWWYKGARIEPPVRGGLAAEISTLCNELYSEAPLIRNELLNRRNLSSAAAAARLRLIERMFSAVDQPTMGFSPTEAPPEKSMYLSVLEAGKVHREQASGFVLAIPAQTADPLRLRPSLMQIAALLEQHNDSRVTVTQIMAVLHQAPFGIRPGVAILLVAIIAAANAHEIAVYERGTFLPRFGATDFLRLIKQPSAFEFQLCRIAGVRAEVFRQLVEVFIAKRSLTHEPDMVDVVRELTRFAATLEEYTRRSTSLDEQSRAVRDALLNAREPGSLLFRDLPAACGLDPFDENQPADERQARLYATALRDTMNVLRANYARLLERIRERVAQHLVGDGAPLDRARVAGRAGRVLLAAREPRLQGYSRALGDTALSDDAWIERLGSYVLAKPPSRWTASDEARACDELDVLTNAFCRVETTAFASEGADPDLTAMRIALTPSDGNEAAHVVRIRPEDEASVRSLVVRLEKALTHSKGSDLQLAALARVLRNFMQPTAGAVSR